MEVGLSILRGLGVLILIILILSSLSKQWCLKFKRELKCKPKLRTLDKREIVNHIGRYPNKESPRISNEAINNDILLILSGLDHG